MIAEVSPEEIAGIAAYVDRASIERLSAPHRSWTSTSSCACSPDAEGQAADAEADACASPARSALVRIADSIRTSCEERRWRGARRGGFASVGGSADGMTDRGALSMEGIWDSP